MKLLIKRNISVFEIDNGDQINNNELEERLKSKYN